MEKPIIDNDQKPAMSKKRRGSIEQYRILRLALPHVLLIIGLCGYILIGSIIFFHIEHPQEELAKQQGLQILQSKLATLESLIGPIDNDDVIMNSSRQYQFRLMMQNYTRDVIKMVRSHKLDHCQEIDKDFQNLWTFPSSVLFSWSVISTIGYGNTSPVTFLGRVVCLIYGVIGIPLSMLIIANVGKFLSEACNYTVRAHKRFFVTLRRRYSDLSNPDGNGIQTRKPSLFSVASGAAGTFFEMPDKPMPFVWMLILVTVYLTVGGLLLPMWEHNLNFFDAFYFSFISITTTGLGDIVPANERFLALTILYTAAGVALSTMSIEILAGYMRKIHYIGRRMKLRNAVLFFEDKAITVGRMFELLGKKYNLPRPQVNRLIEGLEEIAIQSKNFQDDIVNIDIESATNSGPRLIFTDQILNFGIEQKLLQGNGHLPHQDESQDCSASTGMLNDAQATVLFDVDGEIVEKWKLKTFVRCMSKELRRLKGAFTYSKENLRYIDDDRISSVV